MIDISKDKFDIIVVKDQSRLQRNTMDWYIFLNEIVQNRKKLYLYLENTFFDSKDKFIFGIKAMMAEEYSRDLSKKGNAAKIQSVFRLRLTVLLPLCLLVHRIRLLISFLPSIRTEKIEYRYDDFRVLLWLEAVPF